VKVLEYLEYGGHVCRWRGEDFMAVVIQDELVLGIPGPWWRSTPSCHPRVFFALVNDLLVGPAIGAKSIAVKVIYLLLVILAIEGLGVQRDDRDLAPTVGAVAIGQEG